MSHGPHDWLYYLLMTGLVWAPTSLLAVAGILWIADLGRQVRGWR